MPIVNSHRRNRAARIKSICSKARMPLVPRKDSRRSYVGTGGGRALGAGFVDGCGEDEDEDEDEVVVLSGIMPCSRAIFRMAARLEGGSSRGEDGRDFRARIVGGGRERGGEGKGEGDMKTGGGDVILVGARVGKRWGRWMRCV